LGVVMYELITGKKPFVAESSVDMFLKHVNEVPVRPSRFIPDLPVWMDNLVMFLLEKNVDSRPMDAATVGRMIEDIEHKVQNQQSAGAEAANARRIDRLPNDSGFSEEDKEVAKMLRAASGTETKKKKKKKKKKGPWHTQPWAKALMLATPLALIALGLFFAFKPESREKLLAKIESAEKPEEKQKLVDDYVARFGGDTDETTMKVKTIHTELHGLEWNGVLNTRFHSKLDGLKKAQDGEDAQAYELTMRAMDAEKNGRLKEAGELWKGVKTRLADTSDKRKNEWIWVADKHTKDLTAAAREYEKLKDELRRLAVDELPWKGDSTEARTMAAQAIRYETVKDYPKAKEKWQAVAKAAETKPDWLPLFFLANQQAVLAGDVKIADPLSYRVTTVQTFLTETQALQEKAKEDKVAARDLRNRCRDLIDLYTDETNPSFKTIVATAKVLLQQFSAKE
jgi:serine/threonine-protein kinase